MYETLSRGKKHQQDRLRGKWESSGASEHILECRGNFDWLHSNTIGRETTEKGNKRSPRN